MAASSFLLQISSAALLLLSLISGTAVAGATKRRPLLPRGANSLCVNAPFPRLCAHLHAGATPRALAEAAARAAAAKVSASIPLLNAIRSRYAGDRKLASTLDVCAEVYGYAHDSLIEAADGLRSGGDLREVIGDLSAGLTDVGTCDDAFDEDPSLINPVARISRNLNRMVTNSLTLASVVKKKKSH